MPATVNALPRGYTLNEYRIDSLLGAGGFGLTYLATDANLNLKVAVKEYLPNDFAARGEDSTVQPKSPSAGESFKWGLQRFMDEARTLASFRHPNIVRVMGRTMSALIITLRMMNSSTNTAPSDPMKV